MPRTIPTHETLRVEFKSDVTRLSDDDLVLAVVCLANADGGDLYVGVEDDGTVTGLHASHRNSTSLAAFIANRTVPSLSVRAALLTEEGHPIAHIEVPKSPTIVATTTGVIERRRLKHDGTPECVPFHPHEFASRLSDLGQLDDSARPVTSASLADLDPQERTRLREVHRRFQGDASLGELTDDDLGGALGPTTGSGPTRTPAEDYCARLSD